MTSAVRDQKLLNRLQSLLLVSALTALLALVGLLLGGEAGAATAIVLAALAAIVGPRVSPAIVLRMYHARPLGADEAPRLLQLVDQLAANARLAKSPTLYYVPSRMLNAFAVGSTDEAAIAITDGMLRHLNEREIAAVLAHEISHVAHRDMHVMGLADVVSRLTSTFARIGVIGVLLTAPSLLIHGSLSFFLAFLLLALAPGLSTMMQLALSRSREFHADIGSASLTGDPAAMASALLKLERLQPESQVGRVFFPRGEPQMPGMLRTHPPTEERVRRLKKLAPGEIPLSVRHPRTRIPVEHLPRVPDGPRYHAISGLWY